MTPALVVLSALLSAPAPDAGHAAFTWLPPPPLDREAMRRAARDPGALWRSPDGRFGIRPPRDFQAVPRPTADGGVSAGEMGRFVDPGDPGSVLRVGYVAGPILGELGEMTTVVTNVLPRLTSGGRRAEAFSPQRVIVQGRPAVFSEIHVWDPPGPSDAGPARASDDDDDDGGTASTPAGTAHFYAYIHNGAAPGIMLHAQFPLARAEALRPALVATLLGVVLPRLPPPEVEGEPEMPDAVPFPVFLLLTVVLGAVLLRLFSRLRT